MKQKDNHYTAFNEKWFEKNQRILLFVFRIIYKIFPSLLFKSQETKDFGNKKIVKVGTNYATCLVGKREFKTVFFTDWNYSKMLYEAFKPMWWAMHYWDELVADRWVPELSFGFDTLTQYPNYSGEAGATTFDGHVLSLLTNETWANVHSGTTTTSSDSSQSILITITPGSSSNTWNRIHRGFTLFDTSSLTSSATISATVLSLYGFAKYDDTTINPTLNIYTTTPASNTAIADSDFNNIGTVAQCDTAITYAGFSTTGYNDFTLNSTGRGNVSKTGISKFGCRESVYDVANSPPTWSASLFSSFQMRSSDYGSNKPKLVVTYTLASDGGEAGLLLRNCQ